VTEGKIAGFVMVVGDEVEQVYMSALHRGTGVADALLTEAKRQIRDARHSTAWLAVVAGNARARRFYERGGWSDEGIFDYAAAGEDGPIVLPSHRYVKDGTHRHRSRSRTRYLLMTGKPYVEAIVFNGPFVD
jgi:ribosomal protein S18 acetylase RimI-like enzyme